MLLSTTGEMRRSAFEVVELKIMSGRCYRRPDAVPCPSNSDETGPECAPYWTSPTTGEQVWIGWRVALRPTLRQCSPASFFASTKPHKQQSQRQAPSTANNVNASLFLHRYISIQRGISFSLFIPSFSREQQLHSHTFNNKTI